MQQFQQRFAALSRAAASAVCALATISPAPIALAYDGYLDGATLRVALESAKRVRQGSRNIADAKLSAFAYGYIVGITDAFNNDTSGNFFCVPKSLTQAQLAEVVLSYAEKSKSTFDIAYAGDNATHLVFEALGAAYRCKKTEKR